MVIINYKFCKKLKELRVHNKITQIEVSKALNISRSTYSNYENGITEPSIDMIIAISNFYNISIDSLLLDKSSSNLLATPEEIKVDKFDKKSIISSLKNKKYKYLKLLESTTKNINDNIRKIDDLIQLIENSNTEYSEELTYNINTNSELNSSNLYNSKHSNVVGFLDKLQSKRNEQLVDCKSNDYINEFMPKINLLGQVSAGCPNLACENRATFVKVSNSLLCSSKDYFVLQVSGDSMDKIYAPNELLLIEKTNVANNGDMVIALIGTDECTLKEYEKIDDTIYLIPHSTNPVHKVQEYDTNEVPCHIIGVVKNILKGAIIEE